LFFLGTGVVYVGASCVPANDTELVPTHQARLTSHNTAMKVEYNIFSQHDTNEESVRFAEKS
jgi:hypothetical protein